MTTHRPNRPHGFQTRAIHHGYDPQEERGAVVPPIYMTSTYAFPNVAASDAVLAEESDAFLYGRESNPTQDLLERRIAHLEGAEAGVAAASGMAAISSLFLSLMEAGDELVVHHTLYNNATALTEEGLPGSASSWSRWTCRTPTSSGRRSRRGAASSISRRR